MRQPGRPRAQNEDLVNLPNWLVLKLRIEGEEAIRLDNVEVISYEHSYDIRLAMVQRVLRFRDRAGRETTLRSRRFVSMAHSHQAGLEWTLTPENWSGRVEVISGLDGRVTNQMVARYRELVDPAHDFEPLAATQLNEGTAAGRSNCVLDTAKLRAAGVGLHPVTEAVDLALCELARALRAA